MSTTPMADFAKVLVSQSVPATTTTQSGSGSVGIPDVSKLYETDRADIFSQFAKLVNEIADVQISKGELEAEKASIKSRLDSARSDKLIAMLMGAAGNPAAAQFAESAVTNENLLAHLYEAINNNPDEYVRRKKQDASEKIAGFAQGIGALIASGGQSKAEALNAFANYRNALANAAGVGAQYAMSSARQYGSGSDKLTFAEIYSTLLQSGAPKDALKWAKERMYQESNDIIGY